MKFNHNLLFISSQYLDGDNPSQQVLEELQTELAERGFKIHITHQISDGLKIIEKSPNTAGLVFTGSQTIRPLQKSYSTLSAYSAKEMPRRR
ncbi:hypothetical protein MUTS8_17560 [Escherichia coli]|uniref:hypothetical protein n=1 Tax=Escherichia coli TaxID=562 RepID=UPI001F2589C8|nr:hypothetical protein [Escherichia coli]BDY68395.1 hypothetical protein MUTS8_17560 [Escherichia coli]